MDEAEALADRIAILVAGHVSAEDAPATVGGRDRAPVEIRFRVPPGCSRRPCPVPRRGERARPWSSPRSTPRRRWASSSTGPAGPRADLGSLEVRRRSLEDVYLAVAGDRS